VLCYDLRGHGRSTLAPITYGTREAEDLAVEWEEAVRRAAGKPVVAYGVSLGGAITMIGAHRLHGCAGIIVESPFADLASLIGNFLKGPGRVVGLGLCRIGLDWYPEQVRPIDAPVMASGPPLLLGWTTKDRVIPPEHCERLAGAAPRAQTVVSDSAIHAGMVWDDAWRAAVAGFLQRAVTPP
jgi:pimeloyl-ACP methyl ester carboxylesterase